jgi:hypothetical protein
VKVVETVIINYRFLPNAFRDAIAICTRLGLPTWTPTLSAEPYSTLVSTMLHFGSISLMIYRESKIHRLIAESMVVFKNTMWVL